ncbi:DUF1206 domain-containing protein [Pedococcus sp. 5OH_020]|uniref:DUF1206 domain-containing protein n=1 Tax=Pedococcus sp. 5OH_020 TaxID=2989814 RepID=UPI0022E9ECE1|nr:DUF1206 domain-containing protein [Pedococcus sp. 5OH_020]
MDGHDVKLAAARASDHPALEAAARVGYAVSGLLHVLIGWIALQVAFGSSGKNADQSGALGSLAGSGLGKVLLWIGVVGFLGLAVWQLADAVVVYRGREKDLWAERTKSASTAVVYLVLGWSAFTFARGGGHNSRRQTVDFTSKLLDKPGGRLLVVAIGLAVLGVGVYYVYKGVTKKFFEELQKHPGASAVRAGQVGYSAKGVALGIVGVLFVAAGLQRRAQEASGLDGALKSLRDQPFGTVLLVIMAAGLAAFGLYSFARARDASV